jgi:hypothetical protein
MLAPTVCQQDQRGFSSRISLAKIRPRGNEEVASFSRLVSIVSFWFSPTDGNGDSCGSGNDSNNGNDDSIDSRGGELRQLG